jgi:sugar (glycoside-pentoside-hexuronide) transporter
MASRELKPAAKTIYATGDFTVNTALSALGLIYTTYFLTQVAGLRPALAGLVPLVARTLDAFVDPLVGRLSDVTRSRWGRRRIYFLIGAIPFGFFYALMWVPPPFESQWANAAYYTATYTIMGVWMSVLSVPYLALLPEMALEYDERTSLNTYRTVGSLLGIFAAIGIRPVANLLGGGTEGFALSGLAYGALLAAPWFLVYQVTFERPEFAGRSTDEGFVEGVRTLLRHRNFNLLTAFFLMGRISMDLVSALLILYFTYWIGRSEDFELAMLLFLVTVVVSLPAWLRFARGHDKSTVFIVGCVWWMVCSMAFLIVEPDWPRWLLFVLPPLVGLGFAVVDIMPWAMLGEVIDEDDLATGHRREGLYNGVFTFLRKLAGALGVFLVLTILDFAGFEKGAEQTDLVRQMIRVLTAVAPAFFLALSIWLAWNYPLTRAAHDRILEGLERRKAPSASGNQ